MQSLDNFADDIFFITRSKPAPKLREYQVTWPCGSQWEFDRHDLDIPAFVNGEQSGVEHCYRTIKEAIADLTHNHQCKVERTA